MSESIHTQLDQAIDKQLLSILQEGRTAIDQKNGGTVVLPPSPADIRTAMQRLDQVKYQRFTTPQDAQTDDELAKAIEAAKATNKNLRLSHDDQDDEAQELSA